MIDILYIPLIILLYIRTYKYNYLIDDQVPRDGYMYIITDKKHDPSFYDRKRPLGATVTNLGVFLAVCGWIHYFFGWKVALLFALCPLNVFGVAWITGNYYASTLLLLLASHYFLIQSTFFSVLAGALFYVAALNSTLSSIPYLLIALFYPFGWLYVVPLVTFIFGKRMRTGVEKRNKVHENMGVEGGKFKVEYLLNIPKTLAYYIYISFWPSRLGLFHEFGNDKWSRSREGLIMSCILNLAFVALGSAVNKEALFCWYIFMGIYSQFVILGQYTAERYTIIPNLFFCIILERYFSIMGLSEIFWIWGTLWFYRSHLYIKAFENNGAWMTENARAFPRSVGAYNNLANLYLDKGRHFDAIRPLLMALENTKGMSVQRAMLYGNLSVCYLKSGMYQQALHYTILAQTDPNCHKGQKDILEAQRQELELRLKRISRQQKQLRRDGII